MVGTYVLLNRGIQLYAPVVTALSQPGPGEVDKSANI